MVGLIPGQFDQWSQEKARQKALETAAKRSGQLQGFMGNQAQTRPEYDYAQQANDFGVKADTINEESSLNAANNTIIQGVNQSIDQQQAAQQAAVDDWIASLGTGAEPAAETPRTGAYLRALRQSNNMDVNDRTLDGQLGTYGMSADVLRNRQGETEGGWDQQALGRDITPEQFLDSKKLQNKIARYKFGKYLKKQGETGALTKWHEKTNPGSDPAALQLFLNQVLAQMKK